MRLALPMRLEWSIPLAIHLRTVRNEMANLPETSAGDSHLSGRAASSAGRRMPRHAASTAVRSASDIESSALIAARTMLIVLSFMSVVTHPSKVHMSSRARQSRASPMAQSAAAPFSRPRPML